MSKFIKSIDEKKLKDLNERDKTELFIAKGILNKFNKTTYISNEILDEIYETFLYEHLESVIKEDYPIRKFKIKLKMVFDKTEEKELIRKKYLRTQKELNKCKLTFAYLSTPEELSEILYDSFEDYFKDEIPLEVVEKFLTSEMSYTYYENTYPFSDLIKIEESMKILNFLKSKMQSLEINFIEDEEDENKNKIPKKIITNFNITKKELLKNDIYYNALTYNFINEENTSFEDFKNVLLKNFDSHTSEIHFFCSNFLIRQLIFSFKEKFGGKFNLSQAANSKKFRNHKGKHINAQSLSHSIVDKKDALTDEVKEILN